MIDAIVLAGIAIGATRSLGGVLAWLVHAKSIRPGWEARMASPAWPAFVAVALLPFVYDVVTESIGGASIGKLVMGLRVRDLDLFAVTSGMAARRALAGLVDFAALGVVGALLAWKTGQRLGDRWAETIVVRSSDVVADELGRAVAGALVAPLVGQALVTVGFVASVL